MMSPGFFITSRKVGVRLFRGLEGTWSIYRLFGVSGGMCTGPINLPEKSVRNIMIEFQSPEHQL